MSCNHDCKNCKEDCSERSMLERPNRYSSVKKVIGVVSGKGGVGKSMVTSLLAVSLAHNGYKVGILDADITGPSIPKAFGINKPLEGNQFGTLPQKSVGGVEVVSTNLLLENETDPVIWRGPVIANLVKQFWTDVIWKDIDFLLVDMPPGTSDVPLTVFQSLPVSGIIVVTSPQDLVSMIVEKAIKMAEKMNIEVLGLVVNMSNIKCPDCGKKINVFGESKIDKIAIEHNLKVLGKLPIDPELASLIDKGSIDSYDKDYLDDAVEVLSNLPIRIVNVAIPVTEDEEINPHFGHSENFILYTTVNQMIIGKYLLKMEKSGHANVVNKLKAYDVHVVLGGNAGEAALNLLKENNMEYIFGVSGMADQIVLKYLYNELDDICEDHTCDCHDHHSCDCHEEDCENCSEKEGCDHHSCGCGHCH